MKVFYEGPEFGIDDLIESAFFDAKRTIDLESADLIAFGGGSDVGARLYGEEEMVFTHSDKNRDDLCCFLFKKALHLNKKMIGICRGAQFLSVMLGGKLYQHLTGHGGSGGHAIDGSDVSLVTNSYHHQGIIMHDGISVIHAASAAVGFSVGSPNGDKNVSVVESFTANDGSIFGVQWHPEFMYEPKKQTQALAVNWWRCHLRDMMS